MKPEQMLYAMLRIRMVEEKLIELYRSGEIRSLMHLSTGQEAVAVGVCSTLGNGDSVVSTHRCHAHYLAKGGSLDKMFAELAGKQDGCCRGRGGSMHLFDPDAGMKISVPLVGGSIPIAVGIGLAIKLRGNHRVSVAFFGDGAIEEGVFWESVNFSSVHKLPVIFICENNFYATHSHILKRQPGYDIAPRVAPHGINVSGVDGNDVMAVYKETEKMIGLARSGGGPSFLEAKTYRWKEHWGPGEDWHLGYRSEEEGKEWEKRCPINNLLNQIIIRQDHFSEMRSRISQEISSAIEFAKLSPEPKKEELF